jgi:hypothetical protein
MADTKQEGPTTTQITLTTCDGCKHYGTGYWADERIATAGQRAGACSAQVQDRGR